MSGVGYYGAVSVGTGATLIWRGKSVGKGVLVKNAHASQILYLGTDSSVTTSTGMPLAAGESMEFEEFTGTIYGIASGAATDVRYLGE